NRHTLPAQMSKPIDVYIEKEKRTPVSNTQLVSLQNLTPTYYGRDDDAASYIDEDDEEEEEEEERRDNEGGGVDEGEVEEGEEEAEPWSSNKARSQSLPYGQMPRNRARDDQYAQNNWQSVSSQMQQSQSQYYWQYRPHGNMSMPPPARAGLPATPGSITTMLSNASAKTEYNGPNYLPLSPPPSHPN